MVQALVYYCQTHMFTLTFYHCYPVAVLPTVGCEQPSSKKPKLRLSLPNVDVASPSLDEESEALVMSSLPMETTVRRRCFRSVISAVTIFSSESVFML